MEISLAQVWFHELCWHWTNCSPSFLWFLVTPRSASPLSSHWLPFTRDNPVRDLSRYFLCRLAISVQDLCKTFSDSSYEPGRVSRQSLQRDALHYVLSPVHKTFMWSIGCRWCSPDDDGIAMHVFNGLPSEYKGLTNSLRSRDTSVYFDEIHADAASKA